MSDGVKKRLGGLGLGKYMDVFVENDIDFRVTIESGELWESNRVTSSWPKCESSHIFFAKNQGIKRFM